MYDYFNVRLPSIDDSVVVSDSEIFWPFAGLFLSFEAFRF